MPFGETWHEAEARKRAEAKAKRALDDAEYEREEAERKALRAASDARQVQENAKRERYAHEEEIDIVRSELADTEQALELSQARAKLLLASLKACVASMSEVSAVDIHGAWGELYERNHAHALELIATAEPYLT